MIAARRGWSAVYDDDDDDDRPREFCTHASLRPPTTINASDLSSTWRKTACGHTSEIRMHVCMCAQQRGLRVWMWGCCLRKRSISTALSMPNLGPTLRRVGRHRKGWDTRASAERASRPSYSQWGLLLIGPPAPAAQYIHLFFASIVLVRKK